MEGDAAAVWLQAGAGHVAWDLARDGISSHPQAGNTGQHREATTARRQATRAFPRAEGHHVMLSAWPAGHGLLYMISRKNYLLNIITLFWLYSKFLELQTQVSKVGMSKYL